MGVWGGKPGPKCSLLSCSSHRIKNRSLEGGQRRPQRMGLPHRLGEAAREGQRLAKENAPDHKSAELGSDGGSTTSWLCVCDDWHVCAPTPKYTCGNPTRPCHSIRRPLGGDWVVRVQPWRWDSRCYKRGPPSSLPSPCEGTSHLPETRHGSHQNRIGLAP